MPRSAELRPQQGERERVAEQHHLRARSLDLGVQPDGRRRATARRIAGARGPRWKGTRRVEALRSSQDGAMTEIRSGGSSRQSDSSVRWMPPTLGGKSFVTTRVFGISTGGYPPRAGSMREVRDGNDAAEGWRRGRAFAVLSGWGHHRRGGTDARSWLHDLVTADVEGLLDRASRRCLLLTPTGRVRADFHIAAVDGSYLLLQAPDQPDRVDVILATVRALVGRGGDRSR